MNWYIVPRDEQETIMQINYCEKTLTLYTSRKQTADRLIKKIGQPDKIDYDYNGLVNGITYKRSLFDKNIARFFSKCLLIGVFRGKNVSDDELD